MQYVITRMKEPSDRSDEEYNMKLGKRDGKKTKLHWAAHMCVLYTQQQQREKKFTVDNE